MIPVQVSLWNEKTKLEDGVKNAALSMGGQKLTCDYAGKGGPPLTKIGTSFLTIKKTLKFMEKMLEKGLQVEAGSYFPLGGERD